jgi:sugar/nucleoside kinase (ribokinase family)
MIAKQALIIGDVSFDVFLTPRASETLCRKQADEQYICFTYGDKIPVDSVSYYPGGNAANVAIGLRRLGIGTSLQTVFGDDSLSQLLQKHLVDESIDIFLSTNEKNTTCNYATVISYNQERTIFTYHVPRIYQFQPNMTEFPFIYLTSMGEGFELFYESLVLWTQNHPAVKLCFNPGSVQLHCDKSIIERIFSVASYVFLNRNEAEYFTNITNSKGKEADLMKALRAFGAKTIVITDGNNGSYVYSGSSLYTASCFPTHVIEKTGAGDAFNSGFLAATIKSLPITDAILLAASDAASVIQSVGAQEKLLYEKDITSFLEEARKSVTIEHILL